MRNDEDVEDVDIWKDRVQQNTQTINDLKQSQSQISNKQSRLENSIQQLEIKDTLQDKDIETLRITLSEIKEDTIWIRRKITGAIISAVIVGMIGGTIALFFAGFS